MLLYTGFFKKTSLSEGGLVLSCLCHMNQKKKLNNHFFFFFFREGIFFFFFEERGERREEKRTTCKHKMNLNSFSFWLKLATTQVDDGVIEREKRGGGGGVFRL